MHIYISIYISIYLYICVSKKQKKTKNPTNKQIKVYTAFKLVFSLCWDKTSGRGSIVEDWFFGS